LESITFCAQDNSVYFIYPEIELTLNGPCATPTPTPTITQTMTQTPTASPGLTPTSTPSNTATPTYTPTNTSTNTPTPSQTGTVPATPTPTSTSSSYNIYLADKYECLFPGCSLNQTDVLVALPTSETPQYGKFYSALTPDGFAYLLSSPSTGPGLILSPGSFTQCSMACSI